MLQSELLLIFPVVRMVLSVLDTAAQSRTTKIFTLATNVSITKVLDPDKLYILI